MDYATDDIKTIYEIYKEKLFVNRIDVKQLSYQFHAIFSYIKIVINLIKF